MSKTYCLFSHAKAQIVTEKLNLLISLNLSMMAFTFSVLMISLITEALSSWAIVLELSGN